METAIKIFWKLVATVIWMVIYWAIISLVTTVVEKTRKLVKKIKARKTNKEFKKITSTA